MRRVPTSSSAKNNKVIMILCDGLRADITEEEMGYLSNIARTNLCQKHMSVADSPSVSRTNYETLHTGVPSLIHGITSNLVLNKSKMERNIFREMKRNGKRSACIGSSWFYDLYGKDPKYIHVKHKEINEDDNEDITYGRFYSDDLPSEVNPSCESLAHSFQLTDFIIYKYQPDYVLVHLLTPDNIGHNQGVGKEYRKEASRIDSALGATVPRWLDMGYDIVLTSDHGMNQYHNHGGTTREEMETPLYVMSKKPWSLSLTQISHTDIAPMIVERIIPNSDYRTYLNSLTN